MDRELRREDGSFTENSDAGKAERSQQPYESMREQLTVGGESTGNMGGRAYPSSPIDPTRGDRSEFTEFCSGNGIEHIVTSKRRPSTIGKIEAFHEAYVSEAWIYSTHKDFVIYWNYERPHQGIGYLYPADVYFRDLTHHIG